ncbi:hypothetical protein J4429_00235 [Candidatus Pacearchaeota archaeon]|nr:hypothetical protein [Candidatus Pacearchaeota archaeon]
MVDIKKTAQLAIVGLTDPALGIITNVAYDFFKNKIDKALRPNFEKIYEETLNELIKKYPKSKNFIKRFLKNPTVKDLVLDSKIPRVDKLTRITLVGENIKTTTEKDLDVKKIVSEFYHIFKEKIRLNPHLWAKIEEEYQSKITELCVSTNQKIDLLTDQQNQGFKKMLDQMKSLKKDILNQVGDKAEFKAIVRKAPFPLIVCASQFRIINTSLDHILSNIKNFPYIRDNMEEITKEENKLILNYIPKKENNVIKLNFKGFPYKIIYPPFNKIEIWAEQKSGKNYIPITIFSTEERQIKRLAKILFGEINPTLIHRIDFRGKMKIIAKKFLRDICVFDHDPLIYKPITVKGEEIREIISRNILFGQRGSFRRPEIKRIIERSKMEREKQITDIYFIKIRDTTKLCEDPIVLEIDYRGDLAGLFPRSKFTDNQAKKIISEFFEKFGNFNPIKLLSSSL